MNPKISTLKDDFLLDPKITFLNHGSFGATPRPVFDRYQQWQRTLEAEPVAFLGRNAPELLRKSRVDLADYLDTNADNLVYVHNATTGLNIVARSLALGPKDEVLTSSHEYGALDRTWRFLSGKLGFKYINQPISLPVPNPEDFVNLLWRAVTPHTRVIFLSHLTSPTAALFPVAEICQRARSEGILTVIDGAHVPGQLPLSLDSLGADFYSGNLHKWLCAPKGAAFLYARPDVQHLVEPLVVSWGWQSDHPGSSQFVDYLEWTGTDDISAFLTVPDAIQYQKEHQWDQIRAQCHDRLESVISKVATLTHCAPAYSSPDGYAQMAALPLPEGCDAADVQAQLFNRFNVEIPATFWNQRSFLRISIQGYNTDQDVDVFLSALSVVLSNN